MYQLLAYALALLSLGLAQGVLVGRASVVDGDTLEIQDNALYYKLYTSQSGFS